MSTYKDTLNLPTTAFPMKAGLTQREPEILARWQAENLYFKIQKAREDAPLYVLHDGPPFANGDVHMGTALNKILKDLVVKAKTMAGYRAPFLPGWDCHGLPIEYKVVKESKGLTPLQVREKSEAYARKFIGIQREQFKRLGVLGDWEHPYLTLDHAYEAEIIRAFAKFVERGLVYQRKRPVFWSTGAQTALAEAEVEYKDKISPSVYVKFPLESVDRGQNPAENLQSDTSHLASSIIIWTTTPWTLPANLAIAVHHSHKYVLAEVEGHGRLVMAKELLSRFCEKLGVPVGHVLREFEGTELASLKARHPFLDREAPIFAADFVTLEAGTGCVHIAPGHGEDDYHLGLQHGLDLLSPVDDHGKFTEECGVPELVGKYVFEANRDIIALLERKGALVKVEDYTHSYPHCWRSKTPVIFRAVEQFFIRIEAIRKDALEAIDSVDWIPHWGRNRIRGTVESRPDWCISRQRAWGVPLPVFYKENGEPILDAELIRKVADVFASEGTNAWFALDDAEWNRRMGLAATSTRRLDTLDVWIDSGVSHMAVLRRVEGLRAPADLYLEATDQHRGWFQSSLMTSVALMREAPYRQVLTHGFVVDVDTRQKISKSQQGTYEKPMDVEHFVSKYGADLVRLWVCSVNYTDDVPFSEEIFTRLSEAYRRIRNTLRILHANLYDFDASQHAIAFQDMPLVDQWVLTRFEELIENCLAAYENLEFYRVYQMLTQFCAVELSSLYVDITKDRMYCDRASSSRRRATQTAMDRIFNGLTRLLAPVLVFTAEEAWGYYRSGSSVHLELFPKVDSTYSSGEAEKIGQSWFDLRSKISQSIEQAVKDKLIAKPLEARVTIYLPDDERARLIAGRSHEELEEMLILSHLEFVTDANFRISVQPTERKRCERCWRHRPEVGQVETHPELCGRCAEAVE